MAATPSDHPRPLVVPEQGSVIQRETWLETAGRNSKPAQMVVPLLIGKALGLISSQKTAETGVPGKPKGYASTFCVRSRP
jgi:hypothetical protein